MNEETTVPTSETVPEPIEPPATEVPETAFETTDGTVEFTEPATEPAESAAETIWEDMSGTDLEDTIAETTEPVLIVDVIETVGTDLAHVFLFGSFLICGTLIGLQLLRDRHGY